MLFCNVSDSFLSAAVKWLLYVIKNVVQSQRSQLTSALLNWSSHFSVVFVLDAEVVWCQEEPMNMGGYTYVLPRLITSMKAVGRGGYEDLKYVGRAPSAATATGFLKVHHKEQAELVQKAIQREPINFPY